MSTKKHIGKTGSQRWGTPMWLVRRMENHFGRRYTLDVCAEQWSAKCEQYITEEEDAFTVQWTPHRFFLNPPFKNVRDWVGAAYEEVLGGASGSLVLPNSTDTSWFHDYAVLGDVLILQGRVQFEDPPDYEAPIDPKTNLPKKTGNNGGTVIVDFNPRTVRKYNSNKKTRIIRAETVTWSKRNSIHLLDATWGEDQWEVAT